MADKFVGFQGTVDEVQWADLMAGIGQKYTLVKGDPVRSSGRTVIIDPRVQIGCGVMFEHDAAKNVAVPTPATGQWHLLVARRVWSSRSVSYVLVAGNVTADAVQAVPPATLPASRNKTPGLTDDEPIAWVHTRASVTTLGLWQMSVKRNGRVPGLWAMFDPDEQGIYRIVSDVDGSTYTWSGVAWASATQSHVQQDTANSAKNVVTQRGIARAPGSGTATLQKAITFPKQFKDIPFIQVTGGGIQSGAGGTFRPGSTAAAGYAIPSYLAATVNGFTANLTTYTGTLGASADFYISWEATGELA